MNIEDGFVAEKRGVSPTSPSSTQMQAKGTANSGLIAAVIGGVIVAAALGFLGGMQVNSRSISSQSGPGVMGSQTSQGNMSPPGQAGQSAGGGVQPGAPSNGANTTTQTQQGTAQQTTQDTTKNN